MENLLVVVIILENYLAGIKLSHLPSPISLEALSGSSPLTLTPIALQTPITSFSAAFLDFAKIPENLISAPHPFFPGDRAMKEKLLENIELFDAIEYSHFYFSLINFNKKAVRVARRFEKPLIGTSDAHFKMQFDYTYSLIDGEKTVQGVIDAIRKHKVKVVTKPFPKRKIGFVLGTIIGSSMLRKLKIKI